MWATLAVNVAAAYSFIKLTVPDVIACILSLLNAAQIYIIAKKVSETKKSDKDQTTVNET